VRAATLFVISLALAGCGGAESDVTLYLKQRLGPDGPRGQIAPVLEPVRRPARAELSAVQQILVQLRQGPTPTERARGYESTIDARTRFRNVEVRNGTVRVAVDGRPLDYYGVAAVVISLTEVAGVERVRLCCVHRHDGSRMFIHTRNSFAGGWQGTPCALREEHRCLRDE
jgi:Sporulation and spore germination